MKFKTLILTVFILCANNYVSAHFEKLTHYNIYTNYLEIEHLGGQSFIAYGENGNVLRTENSFETWVQEFSGLHNDIIKVKYTNDKLYGITRQGDFIWSEDKGNHWESKRITDGLLTDFYSDNGTFYISKLTDSVLYSNDFGQSWQPMFVTDDTLTAIFSIDNKLIVSKNYKELLIYKDSEWSELDLPKIADGFPSINVRKKNDKLYIITTTEVAILQNDLGWVEYDIKEPGLRDVIETESEIICFAYNSITTKANVVYYNKEIDSVVKIEEIENKNLHTLYHILNHSAIDDFGNLVVTSPGKTIFIKKAKDENWSTKTSFMIPMVDAFQWHYFEDSLSWRFYSFDGNFVKTDNGGQSFEIGKVFIYDTIGNNQIITNSIHNVRYHSKDSIIVSLKSSKYIHAYSNDGGMTFYKDSSLKSLFGANFIFTKNSKEYYYKNIDFIGKQFLLLSSENENSLDTLINIDDLNIAKVIEHNNRLLLIEKSENKEEFIFYQTDENYENPKLIYTLKFDNIDEKKYFLSDIFELKLNSKNDIFLFLRLHSFNGKLSYTTVYRINDFSVPPHKVIANKPIHFYFSNQQFNDNSIFNIEIQDTLTYEYTNYFGKIDLEDQFKYELLEEMSNGFTRIYESKNGNSSYFYNNQGNFWKPIEEERISASVVEQGKLVGIQTYPPYPNPAINYTDMYFYTEIPSQISLLDINIINITTGKTVNNIDYIITNETDWSGTFRIFTNSLSSGSYLISLQLGSDRNIQKLIVIK